MKYVVVPPIVMESFVTSNSIPRHWSWLVGGFFVCFASHMNNLTALVLFSFFLQCFGSDGKLVLHYCKTQAWG